MRAGSVVAAVLAVALACRAAPAGAGARPDVVMGVGATTAVDGAPNNGGASLALSLLWPLEDRFRFGVMGFTDDLGVGRDRLVAPDGTDLGPIPGFHRAVTAAVWRIEAHPSSGGAWDPFATATWGVYRLVDDRHGEVTRATGSAGFGLGMGLARRLATTHAAGVALRYQWLSRGEAGRYLSAAVEWRWQRSATE
jgi:hypothetical protein